MSERREQYLLQSPCNAATIEQEQPNVILVSRADLESEHNHLMARIHQLRRLLGFPPLMTGKQMRRAHE